MKKFVVILLFLLSVPVFSQTLTGKIDLSQTKFESNGIDNYTINNVSGFPEYFGISYYDGHGYLSDTLYLYDIETGNLKYMLHGNGRISESGSVVIDNYYNGDPCIIASGKIIDLTTNKLIYTFNESILEIILTKSNTIVVIATDNIYIYFYSLGTYTGITSKSKTTLPKKLSLSQNYPNPFNPSTTIEYTLPSASHVTVQIFNNNGQLIKSLVDEEKSTGDYSVIWDGKNNNGGRVASGVYFYTVKTDDNELVKKMVLLK